MNFRMKNRGVKREISINLFVNSTKKTNAPFDKCPPWMGYDFRLWLIDLLCKSMDWSLYDWNLRRERVKLGVLLFGVEFFNIFKKMFQKSQKVRSLENSIHDFSSSSKQSHKKRNFYRILYSETSQKQKSQIADMPWITDKTFSPNPNVTIFLKLPPNGGHLSITDKF